jgi:Lysozyme like domain
MTGILIGLILLVGGYFFLDSTNADASVPLSSNGANSPTVSGTLTAAQIAGYAQTAGFDGDDLVTAVAIALAESSGNPNAQDDSNDPSPIGFNAFGLWQINIGENPQYASDNLFDPQTNANDAYEIYSNWSSGFGAWSTYNNGSGTYQNYLADAQSGVNTLG